ncbi:MAG: hypothetical protein ACI4NM_00780 [Bullifex sp.]
MGINRQCPRCGSTHVQLSDERSKHGCLWFLVFGFFYLIWILIKWSIGFVVFFLIDWWMAVIRSVQHRGYVWKCRTFFSGTKQLFYCHDCGYNFRA